MCRCLPPSLRPSPVIRRVGVRISTFEACSSFTRVTARWLAQPPKAAFVTRLRSRQSPSKTARQLPGLSTTPCVEPSSTGDARRRGARVTGTAYQIPKPDATQLKPKMVQFLAPIQLKSLARRQNCKAAESAANRRSPRSMIGAGAPDRIRTCGLCLRRATLYPAELRAHHFPADENGGISPIDEFGAEGNSPPPRFFTRRAARAPGRRRNSADSAPRCRKAASPRRGRWC